MINNIDDILEIMRNVNNDTKYIKLIHREDDLVELGDHLAGAELAEGGPPERLQRHVHGEGRDGRVGGDHRHAGPGDGDAFPEGEGAHGDRKSTRLNSSHIPLSRMPSSA